MRQLLQCNTKEETLEAFLRLRNARESLEEQTTYHDILNLIHRRMTQRKAGTVDEHPVQRLSQIDFQANSGADVQVQQVQPESSEDEDESLFRNMKSAQLCGHATVDEQLQAIFASVQMPPLEQRESEIVYFENQYEMLCEGVVSVSMCASGMKNSGMRTSGKFSTYGEHTSKSALFQLRFIPFYRLQKCFVLVVLKDVSMFNYCQVLRSVNTNKSKMLSHVAHEFRTPLNCIIMLVRKVIDDFPQHDFS